MLDRGKGFVFFLGGGYDHTVVPGRFRYSLAADLSWANSEHMQTEFGITSSGSTTDPRPKALSENYL